MTEIRAGDRFFNNDTDSALVKEKGAMEMANNIIEYRLDSIEIKGYLKNKVVRHDQFGIARTETWRTSVISEFRRIAIKDTLPTKDREYEISQLRKLRYK